MILHTSLHTSLPIVRVIALTTIGFLSSGDLAIGQTGRRAGPPSNDVVALGKSSFSRASVVRDGSTRQDVALGESSAIAVNLMVSLAPTALGTTTPSSLPSYETIFGYWADAVWEMSNQKMKLGTISVFTNGKNADRADVRWVGLGQPRAHISGFQVRNAYIQFCDTYDRGCPNDPDPCGGTTALSFFASDANMRRAGWALAHEFAHYVLGLYDEYSCNVPGALSCTPCTVSNSAGFPQCGDDEVDFSVMNNPFLTQRSILQPLDRLKWGNLSSQNHTLYLPGFVPADGMPATNAQKRALGQSGWGALSRLPANDPPSGGLTSQRQRIYWGIETGVPTGTESIDLDPTTQASPPDGMGTPLSRTEFDVVFPTGGVDVQILLDRSGSMFGDPIVQAKAAAQTLIQNLTANETCVGVASFASDVSQDYPITAITGQTQKDEAKAAVAALVASGGTAMFDGARCALHALQTPPPECADSANLLFLLTDGNDNASHDSGQQCPPMDAMFCEYDDVWNAPQCEQDTIDAFVAGNTPLIVFGYGFLAPTGVLERIARRTGGVFRTAPTSASDLQEAFLAAQVEATEAVGIVQAGSIVGPGGDVDFTFAVDSTIREMAIFVIYEGCLGDVELALSGPSGPVPVAFDCTDVGSLGGCATSCSAFLDSDALGAGGLGSWSLTAMNASSADIAVSANIVANPETGLTYDLAVSSIDGTSIEFPEPIVVTATTNGEFPITGLEIAGTLIGPDGLESAIDFLDSGTGPDDIPGDGVYSAIVDYASNGVHTIEVIACNPGLSASFSMEGFAPCPFLSPGVDGGPPGGVFLPPILENFTRIASIQVLVSGFQADDHPDIAPGTMLAADDTSLPGRINFAGDPDVFSVSTGGLEFLTLRVTELALGMEPELRILAEDGSEIAVVTRADIPVDFDYVAATVHTGGNSTLHAVVTHETGGTGTYRFSAGGQLASDPPYMTVMDIKPGNCPNVFNRNSNGVLKVALIGTGVFESALVEMGTCELVRVDAVGTGVASNEGPPGPSSMIKDIASPFDGVPCDCHSAGEDGVLDLELSFRSADVVSLLELEGLPEDATSAMLALRGTRADGLRFQANDCVQFVPPGNGNNSLPTIVRVKGSVEGAWIEASEPDLWLDEGGFTPFQRQYEPGTRLALTAEPKHLGKAFLGWTIFSGVEGRSSKELKLDVTVPAGGLAIQAHYEK